MERIIFQFHLVRYCIAQITCFSPGFWVPLAFIGQLFDSRKKNLIFCYFFLGTVDQYEIGDLSGKYGSFYNLTHYNKVHIDYHLPLFGKNSIHGRSIVIHKMKVMGSSRWVCADNPAVEKNEMFVMKAKVTFRGPALKGYVILVRRRRNTIYILLYSRKETPLRSEEFTLERFQP